MAPAATVNNVAQVLWNDRKLNIFVGAVVGKTVVGSCCAAGALGGVAAITTQTGATVAVTVGATTGVAVLGALRTIGAVVATTRYYPATGRK
ncbi:MAG: hypothetical protein OXF02_02805 [Simkaniaceae bacterium]|nr:hypothetical protein [Simkaniaceae bacterium]